VTGPRSPRRPEAPGPDWLPPTLPGPPEPPEPPGPGPEWVPPMPPEPPRPSRPPGPPLPPMAPGMPAPPFPGDYDRDPRALVYERLLARRTVVVDRELDISGATLVAAQLMTLDADGDDPITLLVNSPGGPLDAAATVLDTMHLVQCTVDTTCLGQAVGTAAVVVASGTGTRRAGAGARFSLRLPAIELSGPASRLQDEMEHHGRLRDLVLDRLVEATGADRRMVARDVDRGRNLTAAEAVGYGLVDEVLTRRRAGNGDRPPGTTTPDP
jgi:ATP-dependent Clp protease, protease subunit